MQACCILWATLGFKKACKACFNYPALVLTPCIGTWTFGPAARNNKSTSNFYMSCESNKISASYKHTWISFGISLIGAIVTFVVGYDSSWHKLYDFGQDVTYFFTYPACGNYAGLVVISWVLIIVVLPICIGFVQGVDKCCNCLCTITVTDFSEAKICLCTCCPTKCFPVIQRTELDVDNMD